MGIDACANMQVVSATDVVAFGFWKKSNGKSLCMAFNPCSHTYAFAQVGILPSIPLSKTAPEMSVTIDVVAFSLEKQLQSTSLNKLWEGGSASPAEKQVPGHVFIQGTLSVALQLKDDLSLALEVVCKLIMDMDPGNDGAFSPFAEGSNRQTDWAFMLLRRCQARIALAQRQNPRFERLPLRHCRHVRAGEWGRLRLSVWRNYLAELGQAL